MNRSDFHPYYSEVLQAWEVQLQNALKSDGKLETLLEQELVKELSMSQLKELFDHTLSQLDIKVDNKFYSIQSTIGISREYRLELEMDGRIVLNTAVPLNENGFVYDSHSVKALFEKIATALFAAVHERDSDEGSARIAVPENILNPLKEEMDTMEKINRLNFKHFLGAQHDKEFSAEQGSQAVSSNEEPVVKEEASEALAAESVTQSAPEMSVEVYSEDLDLSTDYDFDEEDDFDEDHAFSSDVISEEIVSAVTDIYMETVAEVVQVGDEKLSEDFEYHQAPVEKEPFNFDAVNRELNAVFKAGLSSDREALKAVKATIWELELKQEEEALEESDYQYLLQNVLSVESDEQAVLKWQINLVRALLEHQ